MSMLLRGAIAAAALNEKTAQTVSALREKGIVPTLAVVQDRHTLTGMVGVHDKADIKAMLEKCKA